MNREVIASDWKLKKLEKDQSLSDGFDLHDGSWMDVPSMPMMVHSILIDRGDIKEPWLPGEAENCLWVSESDWVYAVEFGAAKAQGPHVLRFDGVDTVAEIYLNGNHIRSHANTYQPFDVDVTQFLKDTNILAVAVRTPFDVAEDPSKRLAKTSDGLSIRRPNLNYGTYIGPHPYFSRMGIFGNIELISTDQGSIEQLMTKSSVDEHYQSGMISAEISGVTTNGGAIVAVVTNQLGEEQISATIDLSAAGRFGEKLSLKVASPDLWWPRGYGAQALYTLSISLMVNGKTAQKEVRTIGFRKVEMPEPLHFRVNGRPVRMWGGNWVAPDWVTAVPDEDRRNQLFDIAENGNFTAFRVWGVGISPEDEFYEEADRRGFMIWQDFHGLPFSMDEGDRDVCKREADALVKRLMHHPSIFLWCGGNEADQWNDAEFGGPGGEWPGKIAAEQDVAAVCSELDSDRYYHPNSPYYGIDANDPAEWDTHGYTNLWWIPGYEYLNFATEDTRIAAPPIHSMRRFFAPEDLWPDSYTQLYAPGSVLPWPESWMKYTTSLSEKKTGPVELFYDATDAESLVHRLGMAEGAYYRDTVQRQRRGRPADDEQDRRRCGGYLVWKYNDSWPEIYSAKVDYFLEPYHAYYELRRSYAPVLVSIDLGVHAWVWCVNDTTTTVNGTIRVRLFHLDRNEIDKELTKHVIVEPDESTAVMRLDRDGIGVFDRQHLLYADLIDQEGAIISRTNQLADIDRRTDFPDASLELSVVDGEIVLTTDTFARAITLTGNADGDEFGWMFEDNYFDLLPFEEKRVKVLGKHSSGIIRAKAAYSTHTAEASFTR